MGSQRIGHDWRTFSFRCNAVSSLWRQNNPCFYGGYISDFCDILMTVSGEGNGTPLQYSCLENSIGVGAWKAAVHGIAEGRTRLSYFTFTFHFHALEKEMATHSNVLAWRIPGTGKPGGLPSMGVARLKRLSCSSSSNDRLLPFQKIQYVSVIYQSTFSCPLNFAVNLKYL